MENFIQGLPINYLEGLSVFYFTFALFRISTKAKLVHILIVNLLICVGNEVLLNYSPLPSLSGLFNLLTFIVFLNVFMNIPLVWSALSALISYTLLGLVHFLCIFFLDALQIISFNSSSFKFEPMSDYYIVQFVSSSFSLAIATLLIRRKAGFTFSFERLSFKGEKVITVSLIIGTVLSIIIFSFAIKLLWSYVTLLVPLLYLLYFSIQKELYQYQNRKQRHYMK